MSAPITYPVYVKSITHEAEGVIAIEFRPLEGVELPGFTPGAHIDVIADGMPTRSYSLLNASTENHRYVIAVAKDPKSRGGSSFIHEQLRCGAKIRVGEPRNLFPLIETAEETILVAGGIGITPLWCMAQRLDALGKPWKLYYFAREAKYASLLDHIGAAQRDNVQFLYSLSPEETASELLSIFSADTVGRHYYCCGPTGMLEAYKAAGSNIENERVHFESFVPTHEVSTEGGYEVTLAKSGKTVTVEAGQSLLDAILGCGVDVMNSCREGICGACEVPVIVGEPDHRDSILSESERKSGKTMFVCCSGSKSPRLVLDI